MAYEIDMHMLHLVHRYVPSTKKHTILFLKSEIKSLYCLNDVSLLNILFSSNHNIHKSSCGLCFWASDPLIDRF